MSQRPRDVFQRTDDRRMPFDSSRRTVLTVDFDQADFAALKEAARIVDVPIDRFVRTAAMERAMPLLPSGEIDD